MKIRIIIDDVDQDLIATYEWGSDQRLPVVSEFLSIGGEGGLTYEVVRVEWGLVTEQEKGYVPVEEAVLYVELA